MTRPRILTTTDSFTEMETAVTDWFKRPMRLIRKCPHEWRICLPDGTSFGKANSYFVVRQGTSFSLEARENNPPATVVHLPDNQTHTE